MNILGFTLDTHIDLGTIILFGGGVLAFIKMWRAQGLRDQKINMVLFGDIESGIPGMVHDVSDLKEDTNRVFSHLHMDRRTGMDRRH